MVITKTPCPINIMFLEGINLSFLKIILKHFFLNNEPCTKFFLMSATQSTLLKVISFSKVIFSVTFPTPNTLEVDEFSMYRCSPSIFYK